MKKEKKESFFWTSYSDLMTSLFFIMLVLFILTVVILHNKAVNWEETAKATQAQLQKIEQINKSIENIDAKFFKFDVEFKRHTLKNYSAHFSPKSADINDIPEMEREYLLKAGNSIVNFMQNAKREIPDAEYLLIIEGQSSKDSYKLNDELSYARALSLVKFWRDNDITFDGLPCETIISGSGTGTYSGTKKFRIKPEWNNQANQRFVIHIIPKPGNVTK